MSRRNDLRPHVAVVGCHSSTTRFHMRMLTRVNRVGGAPIQPFHYSVPAPGAPEFPDADRYIWVQRDPTITAISQEHRPEASLNGPRMDQVWAGMGDAFEAFRCIRRPVLFIWAQDTIRDPAATMNRIAAFIGVAKVFTDSDVAEAPFDCDLKYVDEANERTAMAPYDDTDAG